MPTIFRQDLDKRGFSRRLMHANHRRAALAAVLCSGWNSSRAQHSRKVANTNSDDVLDT
jgi:hypothetical protein